MLYKISSDVVPYEVRQRYRAFLPQIPRAGTLDWLDAYFRTIGMLGDPLRPKTWPNLPNRFEDWEGYAVGRWQANQRSKYGRNELHDWQIRLLEMLPGWEWHLREASWDEMHAAWLAAQNDPKARGWPNLPRNYVDPQGLHVGEWLKSQRLMESRSALPSIRKHLMQRVAGWCWSPRNDAWQFETLVNSAFDPAASGWPNVKSRYKDSAGRRVGAWANELRHNYRLGKAHPQAIAAVESLPGWRWSLPKRRT